jgi:hypothetical protein
MSLPNETDQDDSAGVETITEGASRGHLRSIPPPTPALRSDEPAHELPTPGTNPDVDPDVDPDGDEYTLLAW